MMENKQGCYLQRWIEQAVVSGILELRSFAKGLFSDIEAVQNALTMPWSYGPSTKSEEEPHPMFFPLCHCRF
jgi:transposase